MASVAQTALSAAEKAFEKVSSNAKIAQLSENTQQSNKNTVISSYFGVAQSDTDNSLKAGTRGPTLLEDIHFREKVSHFDHERIPERVVHARGTGAHGEFVLHTPIPEYTSAGVLTDTSRKTPVFVRFSTVAGFRGSADTVRDIRGFATRFYTPEGNWDIVGNNIPVFFVQDAIKFPDLIHAVKPEPHNEIPQAQTAHDNAWDFFSLAPETTHTVLWAMSDRAIPRSYRMMQGFGVNTFVLVNAEGKRSFVKFHWTPKLGIHSLVWDEAVKLGGQDPDFHRRDLYEAIDSGSYPQWDLGVQIVPEEKENDFEFDLLDASKIIPEDLVPVKYIGTLTLNRNVTEFFPETEQIAFCTQNMVPGIQHSNDPLLQGRAFSYFDTQISRLGGPNFNQIPINRPIGCPFFNHQRDGLHRMPITAGLNYWPNRNGTTHPIDEKQGGYKVQNTLISGTKERTRGPKFEDHFSQATLFYNSLHKVEKQHLVSAFSFELGKVDDVGVRRRMINNLNQVANPLACTVAANIGIDAPEPVAPNLNSTKRSNFLSQIDGSNQTYTAAGRKVGIYLLDGFDAVFVETLMGILTATGCIPMVVGPRKGIVKAGTPGTPNLNTQFSFETCRSTHFDAVYFAGGKGEEYSQTLAKSGRLIHAAREAYSHFKTIGASGSAVKWLEECALPRIILTQDPKEQNQVAVMPGIVRAPSIDVGPEFAKQFIQEIQKHRAWDRDVTEVAA